MTLTASEMSCRNQRASQRRSKAFTLIELLVVIGIIVLLVSITIPMVMRSFRAGARARAAADIQTISVALEAFKADYGDYPRPSDLGAGTTSNVGFADLGRFLIGPGDSLLGTPPNQTTDVPAFNAIRNPPYGIGDVASTGSGSLEYMWTDPSTNATIGPSGPSWTTISYSDSVDGPGIKMNRKKGGPYLQPDKFKTRGLAILDNFGSPILYFVRTPGQPNTHVAGSGGVASYAGPSVAGAAYNTDDNEIFFRASGENTSQYSTKALQVLMGDINGNGYIDGTETEVTLPYILWSAGPDGIFGPYRASGSDPTTAGVWTSSMLQKYDDVTNFR